jgi:hypothetical protein
MNTPNNNLAGERMQKKITMKIEIKHRITNAILFSFECNSIKEAVEEAVKQRADLSYANLSYANLSNASLGGAELGGAELGGAELGGADLSYAIFPDTTPIHKTPPQSKQVAIKRIAKWLKGHWIQKTWIKTPDGAYSGNCQACLHGAVAYLGGKFGPEITRDLDVAGFGVGWNDEDGRTEAEVLEALKEASKQ